GRRARYLLATGLAFPPPAGRDVPYVAERVGDAAGSIAVCLVARRIHRLRARPERLRIDGIHIADVKMQRGRHRLELPVRLAHRDYRVPDSKLRVMHHAALVGVVRNLFRVEGVLEEIDQLRSALRME